MLTPAEQDLRVIARRVAERGSGPLYSAEYFARELVRTLDRLDAARDDLALISELPWPCQKQRACGKPSKASRSATAGRLRSRKH